MLGWSHPQTHPPTHPPRFAALNTWCLQVFTDAKVTHVDAGLGLLLRLPMEPEPAAAFVHVSNLADDKLSAAEVAKKFKVSFTPAELLEECHEHTGSRNSSSSECVMLASWNVTHVTHVL
jgi:hypothetical protein